MAKRPKTGAKGRIWLVVLAAAAVVLLGGGYWLSRGGEVRVPISEQVLQEAVSRTFPIDAKESGMTLHLQDPKIRFPEGEDRIGLGFTFKLRTGILRTDGVVDADSAIRYDPETKGFYLSNLKIRHFEVRNLPRALTDVAKKAVEPALNAACSSQAVYHLSDQELLGQVARKALKRVQVHEGQLVVVFGLQ